MAGLIDIVPTVCGYFGIAPPSQARGKDLSARLGPGADRDGKRFLYSECLFPTSLGCSYLASVVGNGWKYIHSSSPELFDLKNDPAEKFNLFEKEKERARLMKKGLDGILSGTSRMKRDESSYRADEQSLDRLRGIGYLGSGIEEDGELSGGMDDPKDHVDLFNKIVEMLFLRDSGRTEDVKAMCNQILGRRPGLGIIHTVLAAVYEKEGDIDQALAHYREAVNNEYGNKTETVIYHFNLAAFLLKQKKVNEALSNYEAVLQIDADNAKAHCYLANTLAVLGRIDECMNHFSEAIRIDPEYAEAHYHLANILAGSGRVGEAILEYRKSCSLDPKRPEPANNLARILATHERIEYRDPVEAVRFAERACELTGYASPYFLNTLAAAYFASGRRDDAIRTAEKALHLARSGGEKVMAANIYSCLQFYRQGDRQGDTIRGNP